MATEVSYGGISTKTLEEVEISRAIFELYEGGVVCYLFSFQFI